MGIFSTNTYVHGDSSAGGLKRWFGVLSTRTLAQRVSDIGSTVATLEIYAGETISASLDIPANITVVMKPGAKLTVTGVGTELYIARCQCQGKGPFFSIAANAKVLFGPEFQAGITQVFEGDGAATGVRFGLGEQLIANCTFANSTGWTLGTNWSVSGGALTGTAATSSQWAEYPLGITQVKAGQYWGSFQVSVTSGSVCFNSSGHETLFSSSGMHEAWFNPYTVDSKAKFRGGPSNFTGAIDNVSFRQVIGCGLTHVLPEWWGAVADGNVDCTAAIQSAINAVAYPYCPYSTVRMPDLVLLLAGKFKVTSGVYLKPHARIHGVGQATQIDVTGELTGDKLFIVDSTYGGYSVRGKIDVVASFVIYAANATNTNLYLIYVDEGFGNCGIVDLYLEGPQYSTNCVGVFYGPSGNKNQSYINKVYFRFCNSTTYAACYIGPSATGSHQAMVISNMNFNCNGVHFFGGCMNSRVMDVNCEAWPSQEDRIKVCEPFMRKNITAITKGTTTRVSVALASPAVIAAAGMQVMIRGISNSSIEWENLNGLWKVVAGNSTYIDIALDSSSYADYVPGMHGGTVQRCGGTIPRFVSTSWNNFDNCYFDGGDIFVNVFTRSTGTSLFLGNSYNPGLATHAIWDFTVNASNDTTIKNYGPGTFVSKSSLTLSGNHTWMTKNSFVVVNNIDGVTNFGYVRSKVISSSYNAGTNETTFVFEDPIVLNVGTINVHFLKVSWSNRLVDYTSVVTYPDFVSEYLTVGTQKSRSPGNKCSQIRFVAVTTGAALSLAAGATATIDVPSSYLSYGNGAKYLAFVTPPRTIPAYVTAKAIVDANATKATVQLMNHHASTAWDYSSTKWLVEFKYVETFEE